MGIVPPDHQHRYLVSQYKVDF